MNDITAELGIHTSEWFKEGCFVYDEYELNSEYTRMRNRTPIKRKVIDMSIEANRENFEKLKNERKNLLTLEKFSWKYDFNEAALKRYIKKGYLQPFTLNDVKTGKEIAVHLIKHTSEQNQAAIERLQKLKPQRHPQEQSITRFTENSKVNVLELQKLGYGDAKEIAKLIQTGKIKGEIKHKEKPDGKKIIVASVDISDRKSAQQLLANKQKRYIDLETLVKSSGIEIDKIEELILSGDLKAVNSKLFSTEKIDLYIDCKDPKNAEVFDKLLFEKKIQEQIIREQKTEAKEEKRNESSIRMKLIWHFCPNTRTVAKSLIAQDEKLAEVMSEIGNLEKLIRETKTTDAEYEQYKGMLEDLEKEQEALIKKFYGSMWATAGLEEYRHGIEKAKAILEQFKTQGIESIEDPEIKAILSSRA